jgi:hypothetical protein
MRIYLPATQVQPGDHLAGLGRVATIHIHGGDVTIAMDWMDAPDYTFGIDTDLWVDRPEVGAA